MGKKKGKKREEIGVGCCGASAKLTSASPVWVTLPAFLPITPPECDAAVACAPTPMKSRANVLAEDSYGAALLTASPALSDEECSRWIDWGESCGFELQKHAASAYVAHRDNGRLAITSPEIADAVFKRLKPFLPERVGTLKPVGCNPNIRLYKYVAGPVSYTHLTLPTIYSV